MKYRSLLGCITLFLSCPTFAAAPPLASPSNVRGVEPAPMDDRTGSFWIEFTPARIDAKTSYTTYQFGVKPAFCKLQGTYAGASSFATKDFPTGPYRVQAICTCNKTYFPFVNTSPITTGGPRSAIIKGTAVTLPACLPKKK